MQIAITRDIVRACEEAEAAHLAAQVGSVRQPELEPLAQPFAGGIAALTVPQFGRKLNHVTGAGLDEPITPRLLEDLEETYRKRGMKPEVDICPYAASQTLETLQQLSFSVNAFSNTYVRDLTQLPPHTELNHGTRTRVRTLSSHEHELLVTASANGFASQPNPRPMELLFALARSAATRSDTTLYAAEIDGRVAATAALALVQTRYGLVGMLHLSSTLPEHRRCGAQAALLMHRARDAQAMGAQLAMLCARPGTVSARNAERSGFQLAFTKCTFRPA